MTERSSVPCGSCHSCCRGDVIILMPDKGDVVESYQHDILALPIVGPIAVVSKGFDGNCIYLGADGCSIHDRAPVICRTFDCRRLFLSKTRKERRAMVKSGMASAEVFTAGRKRLASLPERTARWLNK